MNGREEHSLKIQESILKKIENEPDVIKNFYYSMQSNTERTKQVYVGYVTTFCKYYDYNIYDLKPQDITRYLEEKVHYRYEGENKIENRESVRSLNLFAIKRFYDFLVENEMCEKNPTTKIKPPKIREDKEIVYLTPEEIEEVSNNIMDGCDGWRYRDLSIFLLGCETGLRCSAITEINLDDINFEENYIRVTEKGNVVKEVYIGNGLKSILGMWRFDREVLLRKKRVKCDAFFISNRRERISQRAINSMIEKYTKSIGKKITPHKMRSSCAMNLYNKTGDIGLVSEVLGHRDISTTLKYARAGKQDKINASKILDDLYRK